jgi:hypothetical protein
MGYMFCTLYCVLYTVWRRVICEKLLVTHLVSTPPTFHGIRNFSTLFIITASTSYPKPHESKLLFIDYTHSPTEEISSKSISDLRIFFRKFKKWKSNIIVKSAEFFLPGMKAQWDEGDGRILLGDNTDSRGFVLRPISFQSVGVRISTGLTFAIYIYIWPHLYSVSIWAWATRSRFKPGNRLPWDVTVLFKTRIIFFFFYSLRRQVNVCSAHSANSKLGLSA